MKTKGLLALQSLGLLMVASTPVAASTQVENVCNYQQVGESCDCQPAWDGGPTQCDCTPTYDWLCHQITIEVPTMPVPVYRFWNGTHHVYSTTDDPPAGYTDEGVKFHLANDAGWNGVPFAYLSSGQGWLFPDTDSSAESAIAGLEELLVYTNVATGDLLFTLDANDPDLVNYQGGVTCGDPPTCSNIIINEYYGGSSSNLVGP
jgi:hypothetical protein